MASTTLLSKRSRQIRPRSTRKRVHAVSTGPGAVAREVYFHAGLAALHGELARAMADGDTEAVAYARKAILAAEKRFRKPVEDSPIE